MKRAPQQVSNPKLLGTVIRSLEAFSKKQKPINSAEEAIVEALINTPKIKQQAAKRICERFRGWSRTTRLKAFGPFGLFDNELSGDTLSYLSKAEVQLESMVTAGYPDTVFSFQEDDVNPPAPPEFPDDTEFTIEYTGLYCRQRTGDRGFWKFSNSDEPYVTTIAVHVDTQGQNEVREEFHPVGTDAYSDVDSGEWREGPIAAIWQGELKGDVSLVVIAMEQDEGDPNAWRDEIRLVVSAISAGLAWSGVGAIPAAIAALLGELLNWILDTGDDEIGQDLMVLTPQSLALFAAWPANPYLGRYDKGEYSIIAEAYVNQTEWVKTNIPYHFTTYHDLSGRYNCLFRVRANKPPKVQWFGPDLNEKARVSRFKPLVGRG
ncbi:hypothetical protein [Pseudoalteromonas sp. T1lg88]|uniref:hypothetical protein n=1 Tax=Pseudoalteromonas sp. T1lg88 TaxID=2077104 RepID=UPI000CF67782|nr:hypothetical protein [Pseudoalteromonas sp. T1lg88]